MLNIKKNLKQHWAQEWDKGYALSQFFFNNVLEALAGAISQEKENKGLEMSKHTLFENDLILYTWNILKILSENF